MASILDQTTAEADARLIDVVGDPQIAGSVLKRGWLEIAGQAASGNTVQELYATLNAVKTYTDPKANNKTYGGTWVNSVTRALDEFERGGATRDCSIIQELTKVTSISAIADLTALTPRIHYKNTITHAEELNYGDHSMYEYIYENLNPASRTTLISGLTNKQLLVGLPLGNSDPTNWAQNTAYTVGNIRENATDGVVYICRKAHTSTAAGTFADDFREGYWAHYWSYVDRDYREMNNGTATFVVTFRLTKYELTGNEEYGWQHATKNRDEEETILYPNVDGYYAQLILDDAKTNATDMTNATPAAPANHVLKVVKRVPKGSGAYDVMRVTTNQGGNASYEAWPNTAKDEDTEYTEYRRTYNAAGVVEEQKRTWILNRSIRRLLLQSAATAHISGGIQFPRAGLYSRYEERWPGRYIATKITFVTEGAWAVE